jgi:hypothetical protein
VKTAIVAAFVAALLGSADLAGCGAGGGSTFSPMSSGNPSPSPSPSPIPSTSPTPTPTPIQLIVGGTVGTAPGWPDDDTSTGGQGQTIDNIKCKVELLNAFHHHVHVSVFVNGAQFWIPKGTGMFNPGPGPSGFIYHATCFYYLHTHDRTGIVHLEPPDGSTVFTLKNWFDLWGQPLSSSNIAGYTGTVGVYVNGMLQPGLDPNTIQLTPFEEITLTIGTAPSWIPNYVFPPGYP